jgi:TRAP-type C4-dicarboxylate transport system substrate-binding protein
MLTNLIKTVIVSIILTASVTANAKVVIKLATAAPKDSIWHEQLKRIDQRWQSASDGEVSLKIYAGTLGDEDDILRRIRVGQLDAGSITTAGLSSIHKATQAMHIPLAFDSNEEMEYVRNGIANELEPLLASKGFKVLSWGEVGWIHFFSREPVTTPDDLRKQKLFVWSSGDSADGEKLWQDFGFDTVALSSTDIMTALQTRMIEAYTTPPLVALASQWFPFTPYMTDLKWAPLTGATIITDKSWQKVPVQFRPELERIVFEEGLNLQLDVRRLEQQATEAMVKRGLKIVPVDAAARKAWQEMAERGYAKIRGSIIPEKYFDETLKLRDEYRALQLANKQKTPAKKG